MDGNSSDYSRLPRDKAELILRIHHEWAALESTIGPLSDEQLCVPGSDGWSIKDNLAHLAAWERFMRLHYLHNVPSYEVLEVEEAIAKREDEDELNEIFFQRNKDRPASDILAELCQYHQEVLADLEQTSSARLMKQLYADDPEARPLMCWVIYNTYEHYQEHRITIRELIEQTQKGLQ